MLTYIFNRHKKLVFSAVLVLSGFLFLEVNIRANNLFDLPQENTDSVNEVFSDLAQIGERVLDFVTWERESFVFTIYPSLSMSPRNGFVYGVMPAVKWNSICQGKINTLTINAETSTKGMLQLQFEHEWYFHEFWLTSGKAYINSREDHYWLGLGRTAYYFDRTEAKIEWDILNRVKPDFWIGGGILFDQNHFDDEARAVLEAENIVGHGAGVLLGIGPKLVLDTRNRTLAPQKGSRIQICSMFIGIGGVGKYKYSRFTFDARKYIPLNQGKTTLALQTICDYAGDDAPFYEAPQLGGKERLRGIGHPLRKTGRAVWLARAEMRQHLWWRIGVVAFAGIGEADNNFQNIFSDIISSGGGGLRFRMLPNDPFNVRCDFGISSAGTTGFFISLKEAF
jgi:hypothetical protein